MYMMRDVILNFAKQFTFRPVIENKKRLKKPKQLIIAGMGGSALAGDILKSRCRSLPIVVHRNYGLPPMDYKILKQYLVIVSSYSGNTEEAIDVFKTALKKRIPLAVLTTGGTLLTLAQQSNVPYVQLPSTGIQPRSASGYSFMGLVALLQDKKLLAEAEALSVTLKPARYKRKGKTLSGNIKGKIPVIYASQANEAVAYNWKIKFNETGKIPAFYNVFPELNHNEMTGFDVKQTTEKLSRLFCFIFLKDKKDPKRIQRRMEILEKIYKARGLPLETVAIEGATPFDGIFSSLVLSDWTAYYTAEGYNFDPEHVPMVEEFKALLKKY